MSFIETVFCRKNTYIEIGCDLSEYDSLKSILDYFYGEKDFIEIFYLLDGILK